MFKLNKQKTNKIQGMNKKGVKNKSMHEYSHKQNV